MLPWPEFRPLARLAALAASLALLGNWLAGALLFVRGLQTDLDHVLTLMFSGAWTPAAVRAAAAGLGVPAEFTAWAWLGIELVLVTGFGAAGLLLFWRKPDGFGTLLGVTFVLIGTRLAGPVTVALADVAAWLYAPLEYLSLLAFIAFASLLFVFPDGRRVPAWSPWLAGVVVAFSLVRALHNALPGALNYDVLDAVVYLGYFCAGVAAQAYRYRRVSGPVERQQTKWALAALTVFLVVGVGLWPFFPNLLEQTRPPTAMELAVFLLYYAALTVAAALFIAAVALAVLRYRLWDIDIIIRRTLVYSLLSGFLALTYFGLVIGLQSVVTALGGARSEWVTVVSTLTVAALFAPLRARVQNFIDRRLYRRKYDAARVLSDFGAAVRDETDLNALTARLAAVIQDTMQPEALSLWLAVQPGRARRPAPLSDNPAASPVEPLGGATPPSLARRRNAPRNDPGTPAL